MQGHLAQDEQIIFTKLFLLLSSLKSLYGIPQPIFQDKSKCLCKADIFMTHNSVCLSVTKLTCMPVC